MIGFLRPLGEVHTVEEIAATGVTAFSVELMPRITRAQNMDALSSMSTIAGYKAVLLAADTLPRIFPMLTTAAGTITPSRVLVIGAGVAGLQAIATARRLGAVVSAYDLRPAVKEQVQSLGGRFVELPIEAADAQDAGGYAKAQDESFYQRQRELLGKVVAESDVVITTAVVPGKKSPVLVTKEMVAAMAPGSVIVDLAAERGGNCELTRTGEKVVEHGVTIFGIDQPGQHRALSCQPDVQQEPHEFPVAHGEGRKAPAQPGGRDHAQHHRHHGRRNREPARARVLQPARTGVAIEGSELMNKADLINSLYVFMLAAFIGFEVIRRVSPLLHTPLMSLTNALDAIAVVGAIILAGEHKSTLATVLGTIAIVAATSNAVGGFIITDRMLKMFKSSRTQKP